MPVLIKTWMDGVPLEDSAREQTERVAALVKPDGTPLVFEEGIALMPDTHLGYGATVGSVIPTKAALIPAAVGVDIGCGMIARRTTLTANDLPDSLSAMRAAIEGTIPHGGPGLKGSWAESAKGTGYVYDMSEHMRRDFASYYGDNLLNILIKHPKLMSKRDTSANDTLRNAQNQFGTLGTGNHFIEVCLDESDRVWLMLHSGSRGIGNRIGTYFIQRAKAHADQIGAILPGGEGKNLAWLDEGTEDFDDYVTALRWAQGYAAANREQMMEMLASQVAFHTGGYGFEAAQAVNCHHNYAAEETHFGESIWVTRKGAIRAGVGELGIIPGSMGAKSYIVEGKGHPDAYESASHGAGRVMSRTRARAEISMDEFAAAMEGIEAPVDEDHLDEAPQSYKDIDAVMAAQTDLVSIRHTLRAVLNVKG